MSNQELCEFATTPENVKLRARIREQMRIGGEHELAEIVKASGDYSPIITLMAYDFAGTRAEGELLISMLCRMAYWWLIERSRLEYELGSLKYRSNKVPDIDDIPF